MVGDERVGCLNEPPIEPGDLVLTPADELGVYRENGQSYYIAHHDLIAAVISACRLESLDFIKLAHMMPTKNDKHLQLI